MKFQLVPYSIEFQAAWNEAARRMRGQSFLFDRSFMDYHKDRFEDISLLVFDNRKRVVALLPANVCPNGGRKVESHGGLTYGGLLVAPCLGAREVMEIFELCRAFYREAGFEQLIYKPMPHIYATYPAEEDLYALFRDGAVLETRSLSTVIDLRTPYSLSELRGRKVRRAEKAGLKYVESGLEQVEAFWQMLDEVLTSRHGTHPVHTVSELRLLMERFPKQIRLFSVLEGEALVGGCLLFLTTRVVHVQYIAASTRGKEIGALDFLFDRLILLFQADAAERPYFDFGISTEQGGRVLNEGLTFQKEGFGGRAICYDSYKLRL